MIRDDLEQRSSSKTFPDKTALAFFVVVLPMMYYCINLTLVNFSRFLDEIGATQLASVSGRFASFKYECVSRSSRQTTSVFHINHSFSWQSIDLFLGLFSGFGRSLNWEVDNLVEFVHICHYFMIYERYVCEVLSALKTSGYLFLARNVMAFASHEHEEIFIFEDLSLAHSSANFQQFVSNRLTELEQN